MALAAFVAVAGWDGAGDSLPRRLSELSEPALVGLLLVGAFVISIASMAWLGRAQPPDTLEGDDDDEDGLVAGGEAPSFEAESIDGGARSLDELRRPGLPTLMVFADPGCGSCICAY